MQRRLAGRGNRRLFDRTHRPIAFANVVFLGLLEVIECPEDRQPALLVGRCEARQVRGIHDQHGVKLEPHVRPWLNVAHPGQLQPRQKLLVAEAAVNPGRDRLEQFFARRFFEQPHDWLDLRVESHAVGLRRRFGRAHRCQAGQKAQLAQSGHGACASHVLQETSACRTVGHGAALLDLDIATAFQETRYARALYRRAATLLT